jgi:hypothetical protein
MAGVASNAIREVRGAFRDVNGRGNGSETFRKVWRGGSWQWISGPMPRAAFLSKDRHVETFGPVEDGELVAQFGRDGLRGKCDLEKFWIVTGDEAHKPLQPVESFKRTTLREYTVTLRGGTRIVVPDPLAR